MQCKLEEISGIEDAGQLHVKGPNIMKGYLLSDNPGKLVPPESKFGKGWYDTGDIVHIDKEGYISIRGRSKRFAKISGEMISLTAVEHLITEVWPDAQHAVVSLPDPKKGEQLILLTTQKDATSKHLFASVKGVSAISIPKKLIVVDNLALLPTGKTDYPSVTKLAIEKIL
jgi:acyl-[acyl-carrier-protein]-phospholipid O-acyltransferase/long-chain-fatty-acid--[acyl-carrier-protein] ligase